MTAIGNMTSHFLNTWGEPIARAVISTATEDSKAGRVARNILLVGGGICALVRSFRRKEAETTLPQKASSVALKVLSVVAIAYGSYRIVEELQEPELPPEAAFVPYFDPSTVRVVHCQDREALLEPFSNCTATRTLVQELGERGPFTISCKAPEGKPRSYVDLENRVSYISEEKIGRVLHGLISLINRETLQRGIDTMCYLPPNEYAAVAEETEHELITAINVVTKMCIDERAWPGVALPKDSSSDCRDCFRKDYYSLWYYLCEHRRAM
ncbi:MAG: hypothetical protein JSR76_06205 [Verrucomicrobia bacterium]|nr:hypothetical protein [Verrucomicrobiota bacterium]